MKLGGERVYSKTSLNHVHSYLYLTSVEEQHNHTMAGTTSLGIAQGVSHVHCFKGSTSRDKGHVHYYSDMTGPAVYLADGSHVHCQRGVTAIAQYHVHSYCSSDYPSF